MQPLGRKKCTFKGKTKEWCGKHDNGKPVKMWWEDEIIPDKKGLRRKRKQELLKLKKRINK